MSKDDDTDEGLYLAVVNDEEQYSIWQDGLPIPAGWRAVTKAQPKKDCLDHIEKVWTDMRPLSLRKAMEADRRGS